ncbi:holin class II [Streptomyces phage Shaeky]|uniref:Holin class II n=1 Tax=Streptomyces phage Shaeky TaxID=2767586 RepID=A0A873WE13_9CAUD|nr:holin class II [Streptomyces phage Shaeky]
MEFVKAHGARLYAVAVALLALLAHFVPSVPTELVLALVAAVLGLGEAVQRTEDRKTAEAYAADPRA